MDLNSDLNRPSFEIVGLFIKEAKLYIVDVGQRVSIALGSEIIDIENTNYGLLNMRNNEDRPSVNQGALLKNRKMHLSPREVGT